MADIMEPLIFGNPSLPEGTAERPLVTFALFAYNQEKFILEAVEGAFSQTYSPLEIILSDDCSSDQPYQIMHEMAARYEGPHSVIVRRSLVNRGLGLHFDDVCQTAKGQMLVVAAGDDISHSYRTSSLVSFLLQENRDYAESNYNVISNSGELIGSNITSDHSSSALWRIVKSDSDYFVFGATAIYRSDFVRHALNSARSTINLGGLSHEDMLLSAYGVAIKSKPVKYVDGPLIDYRFNTDSISNFISPRRSFKDERALVDREIFTAKARISITNSVIEMSSHHSSLARVLDRDQCNEVIRTATLLLLCNEGNLIMRIRSVKLVRNSSDLRTFLPRIFGTYCLTIVRVIRNSLLGK